MVQGRIVMPGLLAVAVMAGHCGLDTWEGNSEIVLARAATPPAFNASLFAAASAFGSVLYYMGYSGCARPRLSSEH